MFEIHHLRQNCSKLRTITQYSKGGVRTPTPEYCVNDFIAKMCVTYGDGEGVGFIGGDYDSQVPD